MAAEVAIKTENNRYAPTIHNRPAVADPTEAGSIAKRLRFGTSASKELALYDEYLGIAPIGGGQQKKVIFLNAGGGYPHFARPAGEHFIADVDASKLVPQSGFPTCLLARSRNATLASKKQVDSSFPELVVACKVEGSFPQYTLAVGDACTMVDKKAESALLMAFDLQCDHNLLVVAIADVLLGVSHTTKTQRRAFACLTRLVPHNSMDDTISLPGGPPMLAWVKATELSLSVDVDADKELVATAVHDVLHILATDACKEAEIKAALRSAAFKVVTVPEPAPSLTRSRIPDEDVWAYMESDEDDEADPDAAQSPLLKGKLHATVASLEAKVKQHGEKLEAFGKSRTAVEQRLTTLAKQVSGFSRAVTGAKSDIKKTVTDTVTAEVKKLQPAAAAPQLPLEFNALKKDLAAAQKTVEDQGKKIAALEWQIQHVQATQNTMMSVQVPTWPAAAAYPPAAGPTNLPSAGKPRQHPRPRHPQPYPQQQVPTPLLAYTHGYEDEEEAEELEEVEEYEELEDDARRGGYTPAPSKKRAPPMRAVATRSSPRKNKGRIASAYVDEHFRGYRC
eukprot:jgi/Mesvir1/3127/Mv16300-RA.1